jgi:DNA polymerase elongation subunit (family B)
MATPFHSSMVGSSALLEHIIFYNLTKDNKVIRYGINSELSKSIEAEELQSFPPIRNKKGVALKVNKIPARGPKTSYSAIINKFPGAWVKDPDSKIINDGSIIIDLDATALYPSMILQSNISFDSYQARIIPPVCYRTLSLLESFLGKGNLPLPQLASTLAPMIFAYVDREQEASKEELSTNIYYTLLYLFNQLEISKIKYDNLIQPTNTKESIALKTLLIPILDIMNNIHHESEKYNNFAYDKVFLPYQDLKQKYPHIYILHYPNEANSYIKKYPLDEGLSFIQTKTMSFAGTLFSKHDEKMGLFADFLQRMKNMRTMYKNKAKEYQIGSIEHNYNDARQKTVKIVMNTTYGLYGLSTFRYSNHWLARSITNNGLITIKAAQYVAEEYLKAYYK